MATSKNGTTKKQLAAGLKYSDAVAAAGGVATNAQTGAKTYSSSNSGASSARDIDAVVDSEARVIKAASPVSSLPGAAGGPQPAVAPAGVVTTSDPATQAVDNLGNLITQGLKNPPITPSLTNPMGEYQPAFDPNTDPAVAKEVAEGNKIYEDRRKALQKERDSAIADLKSSMQADKQLLGQEQKKNMAVNVRNLAYLQQGGQSASAQAFLNDLEVSHGREQANLTAKYNSAILQARVAYSEKDFQLAESMMKNAQEIKKDAYQRNQDYLDNALKINQQIMQQKQFEFTKQQAQYENERRAMDFAVKHHIDQQFYDIGGVVIRTSDGVTMPDMQAFLDAGGKADFSNVFVVKPGSEEARAYAYDMMTKYIDAGITPEDDFATIKAKVQNSAIYREQVRPPSSGNSGSTGLTAADYNLMLKMAPAAVPQLASQGMGWAAIAKHFTDQGIDPGSPDIDDALHRQFQTQEDYRKWQQQTKYKQPVVDNNFNGIPDNEE